MSNRCNTPVVAADQIGVLIEQPDVTDYDVGYDMAFGGTIAGLHVTCALGTGTCSVKINGVAATGLTGVAISQQRNRYTATALNQFSPGDDITFTIESGDVSLINVKATIVITR